MDPPPDIGRLERVAREVAAEWDLDLGEPFALSRHSFVAPAGDDAVFKVTPPEDDESDEEADALELWSGNGAARLIRHDRERGAMLIERAFPGSDIAGLPDDEATAIAVEVGLRLWRHAGEPFRWVGDHVPRWLEDAEHSIRPPDDLTRVARRVHARVRPARSTLVHGDFHHHNILDAGGRYLAIDPKPMLGEAEFDVAPFLWNPMGYRMSSEVTERRLAAFASAGLDESRMRSWAVIRGSYLVGDEAERELIASLV